MSSFQVPIILTKPRSNKYHHHGNDGNSEVVLDVTIHNGRENGDLTLDNASFELIQCPTSLKTADFYELEDDVALKRLYYQEMAACLQQVLNCDKVYCYNHIVRNAAKPGAQGYASARPHADSSPLHSEEWALCHLHWEGDRTRYKRFCNMTLWRNIDDTSPIQNSSLAALDERTVVKPDDYIARQGVGDKSHETKYGLSARHATTCHRWYYFPQMQKHEGLLFKQYDSDWTKSGRICFHMSVHDPRVPPTAAPRQSIELRFLAFWKEAEIDSMPTTNDVDIPTTNNNKKSDNDGGTTVRDLPPPSYSGNPADYEDMFISTVLYVPGWGESAKQWLRELMQQAGGGSLEKGVTAWLKRLVQGMDQTKHFEEQSKQEIVEYLLHSERFMTVCQTNLADCVVVVDNKYSGNPEDYVERFVKATNSIPKWPQSAKDWLKDTLQKTGVGMDKAIASWTRRLVQDKDNKLKMKDFDAKAKREIEAYLLSHEKYLEACRINLTG